METFDINEVLNRPLPEREKQKERPDVVRWVAVGAAALTLAGLGWIGHYEREQKKPEPEVELDLAEQQTNEQREFYGLPPLKASQKLRNSACTKADDMLKRDYWGHFAPDGTGDPGQLIKEAGVVYVVAGENNYFTNRADPRPVESWMESPGHRAAILSEDFTRVGVCERSGPYQGLPRALIFVQHFSTPRTEIPVGFWERHGG